MDTYISGNIANKSDCCIEYTPESGANLDLIVKSKIDTMYGDSIQTLVEATLKDLGIDKGRIVVNDSGALPFVIQARIEAAVKAAVPHSSVSSLPTLKDHVNYSSTRDRFRRSRLYLPGNQPKLMLNAGIHNPDGIILDLEDSVSPAEKLSARLIVRNALRVLDFFGAERMVRINQGELGMKDIEAIVPNNVHLILIPKIETAHQLKEFDNKIASVMMDCGRTEPVFLMPILESALGILNALEIAQASPNNVALTIGLEDYTADIGTQRTLQGTESFFARSMLVNAARAAGLQPIDTVFSDVNDMDGLRESVIEAKSLGFDGKGCIHPRQIRPLHEAFAPTEIEISKAQKIVLAFEDAERKGFGVVSLGSKMIDPPVVKRALHTVKLAINTGIISKDWQTENISN